MLRIFLPLYLILSVFFASFIIAVKYLPDILLSGKVYDSTERLLRGTFYLVEQELQDLSYLQQQEAVANLQSHFKFPIFLLKQEDPLINEEVWKRLLTGKIAIPETEGDKVLKKMQSSNTIMVLNFSDNQRELDHKEAAGTYYLIRKRLLNHPQDEWNRIVNNLQIHFGVPIQLKLLSDINLEENEQQHLNKGKIIALDHDTNQWRFIAKLDNSDYVLVFGPIRQAITSVGFFTAIFFSLFLFLAIALFLWFRPLWKSINELSRTADEFGSGKLQTRADINQSAILGNLANQFNNMADRLSGLIAGHRELTNAVSHELRTPIARMRFGLDMLEKADDSAKQRFMNGLSSDVDDLESLVNELLHYARFEKVNPIEKQQMIAIVPWLQDIVENAKGYAKGLNITLHIHDASKDKCVQFSPRYIARAIHNLLRNACQYGKKEIKLTLEIKEENIIIHVDDDGEGIPEKDRKWVFKAFTRLDKSRDKRSGGHGLGLAIADKIILAHKGYISISNSPLGGARFTLYWPGNILK
ncbi:MAG: hypothetical protein KAH20_05640 [Methylococcales bacterium]|nr:hypothetical protein [Methylococcales bacterium]